MIQRFILFCWVSSSLTISTAAFSPLQNARSSPTLSSVRARENVALYMAKSKKKKKPSMAERRKRRQQKSLGGPNPYADLPSPNLDFSRDVVDEADEPIQVANPEAAAEKAQELLKAQRESVNMLTMVKEKIIARLSDGGVRNTLETNGFVIVDSFFGKDEEASASVLKDLLEEGNTMLEKGGMEVDTKNLGKGEYIVPIEGGGKQYTTCPRMVEIVVSATKNVPEAFGESDDEETKSETKSESPESDKPSVLNLNDSACMATLRTFDRKALKASLVLLTGEDDDGVLDAAAEETPLAVIADGDDDKRRLSLHYYIVPDAWDENCGGGLEFEGGAKAGAKLDRLVVFYSDTTKCKAIPWKGSDVDGDSSSKLTIGSSIELHLIAKSK